MYPWATSKNVRQTAQAIAKIAYIAAQKGFHIIIDDYHWVRLSRDGKFQGSIPLNILEDATQISEEYILQEIERMS
jgi:hypothetical protein